MSLWPFTANRRRVWDMNRLVEGSSPSKTSIEQWWCRTKGSYEIWFGRLCFFGTGMHGNKTVQHCFVEASSQLNEPPLYTEISRLRNGTIHSAANVRCSYDTKTCQLCIGGTFKHYPGSAIRHMQLRKLYNVKHLNRIESKDWYKRRSEYTIQIGQKLEMMLG